MGIDHEAAVLGAAAGLDFNGSNAGLIRKTEDDDDDTFSDMSDDEGGDRLPGGYELHVHSGMDNAADLATEARVEEQAAYIVDLEEDRLRLESENEVLTDQNQRLKDKLYVLECQIDRLKTKLRTAGCSDASDNDVDDVNDDRHADEHVPHADEQHDDSPSLSADHGHPANES
eukprot:jgi/Chrzof1/196/Cz01g06200.t1